MIKKYSTKPEKIEAVQFTGCTESFVEIREWVGEQFYYDYQSSPHVYLDNDTCNFVFKLDWVVKDAKGYFNVYRPAEFERLFAETK